MKIELSYEMDRRNIYIDYILHFHALMVQILCIFPQVFPKHCMILSISAFFLNSSELFAWASFLSVFGSSYLFSPSYSFIFKFGYPGL